MKSRVTKHSSFRICILLVAALAAAGGSLSLSHAQPGNHPRCIQTALHTILDNARAATKLRPLEEITELRIASYNLLNLREHVGKYRYTPDGALVMKSAPQPAELEKLVGKARAIRDISPDILIAQEVEGGLETLQKFANEELGGLFNAYLVAGNDSRGINIGFLVKKDLPITVEMETHKAITWVDPTKAARVESPLYSRDLPAMIVRSASEGNPDRPLLVILGNHNKSMRSRPGDPESRVLRTAQVAKTAEVAKHYRERFGKDARIILGGDFNTHIAADDMLALRTSGFSEAFSVSKVKTFAKDRVTHTYHPRDGPTKMSQLDAFFVSPELSQDVSRTWVYRYKDAEGNPLRLPRTHAERELNPSDHFPVVMDLDFQPIYTRFRAGQGLSSN